MREVDRSYGSIVLLNQATHSPKVRRGIQKSDDGVYKCKALMRAIGMTFVVVDNP